MRYCITHDLMADYFKENERDTAHPRKSGALHFISASLNKTQPHREKATRTSFLQETGARRFLLSLASLKHH
jgi:hypothetical protein